MKLNVLSSFVSSDSSISFAPVAIYKRMLSAYSRVIFAVLLAVFCHAQASAPSHHDNKLASFDNETRCSWKCTAIESNLTEDVKNTIAKGGLIHLVVKYENKVDDKCLNQTTRNSSGNATEHFQIWMANKQRSTSVKVFASLENLMFCDDSNEEHRKIRALCTLKPPKTTAITQITPTHYSGSLPVVFSQGHLADIGITFDSIGCNTKVKDYGQPCLNISKSSENSTTISKCKRDGWPVAVFTWLCIVFFTVFTYYYPAVICLFTPTESSENDVRQIVLEGASPVSFRSLMGNYFFSGNHTIWHRARLFILRGVVLPFSFLGPAIFVVFLQYKKLIPTFSVFGVSHLSQPRMLVYSGCYYTLAFYISFFDTSSFKANHPCFVCKRVKSKILDCQEVLPKRIINHLRLQPLFLVNCWRAFIRYLLNYFKVSFLVLPSACKVSPIFFLRLSAFIVFLFSLPAVTATLLIAMLLVVGISIMLTSPIFILWLYSFNPVSVNSKYPAGLKLILLFIYIMLAIPTLFGALYVLLLAGTGVLVALVLVFALLLSEESLPFMACIVLVFYYVWSSYCSFTNKYQDLALALFKQYKRSGHRQVTDLTKNTDLCQENTPNSADNENSVMKIPKGLFLVSCEELMPIREGVCILILKITIIVSFVLLVFSLTMLLNVDATPVMKALLTFFTGSFPKIVAIYVDGGRQKKIEAMVNDEKIPKIVGDYITGTSSKSIQGHENRSVDSDETLLLDVGGENIEMVNM